MIKYLIFVPIFVVSTIGIAQNKFGLSVNLGGFIAENPRSDNQKIGLDISIGTLISVYKERFYVKPTPNLRMIEFHANSNTLSNESYLIAGIGLELLARFGEFDKMQLYPFIKTAYNFVAMTLTNGTNGGTNANQNILSGGSPSIGLGIIGEFRSFQLKIQQEFLHSKLIYAEDVTQIQKDEYANDFAFNNFSISLGYTFNRR